MFLFELDDDPQITPQIVALTNQLEQAVNDGDIDADNYTLAELQDYFQDYDIILDDEDLYNMISVPPLKDLVSNIKGNKVIFKGYSDTSDVDTTDKTDDDNKKTVAKMAHKALK